MTPYEQAENLVEKAESIQELIQEQACTILDLEDQLEKLLGEVAYLENKLTEHEDENSRLWTKIDDLELQQSSMDLST